MEKKITQSKNYFTFVFVRKKVIENIWICIYHDDFFDEGFVAAKTSSFHCSYVRSQPRNKKELGAFTHFIATLRDKKNNYHVKSIKVKG